MALENGKTDFDDIIKSLDELKEGDVINIHDYGLCRVRAIGEVPEHPSEISVQHIYSPEVSDIDITNESMTIRAGKRSGLGEGVCNFDEVAITLKSREGYRGWKYSGKDGRVRRV